jgi:hypothetical protein
MLKRNNNYSRILVGVLVSPLTTDALVIKLAEEQARSSELDNLVLDMEATIGQFRDLVGNLQRSVHLLLLHRACY